MAGLGDSLPWMDDEDWGFPSAQKGIAKLGNVPCPVLPGLQRYPSPLGAGRA